MPPVTTWRARTPEPGGTTTRLQQVKRGIANNQYLQNKREKISLFGYMLSVRRRQDRLQGLEPLYLGLLSWEEEEGTASNTGRICYRD
jgi:hypothetical protein